jgi:hypothetical protein
VGIIVVRSETIEDPVHLVFKARLKRYEIRSLLIDCTYIIYRLFVIVDARYWSPQYRAGPRYNALTHVCGPLLHVVIRRRLISAMRIRRHVPHASF